MPQGIGKEGDEREPECARCDVLWRGGQARRAFSSTENERRRQRERDMNKNRNRNRVRDRDRDRVMDRDRDEGTCLPYPYRRTSKRNASSEFQTIGAQQNLGDPIDLHHPQDSST